MRTAATLRDRPKGKLFLYPSGWGRGEVANEGIIRHANNTCWCTRCLVPINLFRVYCCTLKYGSGGRVQSVKCGGAGGGGGAAGRASTQRQVQKKKKRILGGLSGASTYLFHLDGTQQQSPHTTQQKEESLRVCRTQQFFAMGGNQFNSVPPAKRFREVSARYPSV